ncbi:MAG: AAA family ATPase [Prochloraceae cyanobacterium]|nr:AAA family ATPase [Prochloraceae cyanobacterium]
MLLLIRIILWLLVIWVAFWLLSLFIKMLPLLLFIVACAAAICATYSLLPYQLRLPAIERWLDPNWQPLPPRPATPTNSPNYPNYPSNNFTPSTPHTPTSPTPVPPPRQYTQPELDFTRIARRTVKLPDREDLKAKLRAKVIGQDAAINALVRVTLAQLAAQNKTKPLVVFLPGPTGTGKTELSKALADVLDVKLVRFDMGEFAESHKASNLFGSAKGYVGSEDGGELPNALRTNKKRCVFLFDEVEKAHKSLWRQMLAFFDEGRVSDTKGSVTAPKDTICLLTSNLEADKIGSNPEAAKDILRESGYFPTEFLGRIDKVIPLLRLSQQDTARLIVVLTKQIADNYGISLLVNDDSVQALFDATYDEAQKYGGRGIKDKVSDLLIEDFFDLQADRVSQAELRWDGKRLKVIPLL